MDAEGEVVEEEEEEVVVVDSITDQMDHQFRQLLENEVFLIHKHKKKKSPSRWMFFFLSPCSLTLSMFASSVHQEDMFVISVSLSLFSF